MKRPSNQCGLTSPNRPHRPPRSNRDFFFSKERQPEGLLGKTTNSELNHQELESPEKIHRPISYEFISQVIFSAFNGAISPTIQSIQVRTRMIFNQSNFFHLGETFKIPQKEEPSPDPDPLRTVLLKWVKPTSFMERLQLLKICSTQTYL